MVHRSILLLVACLAGCIDPMLDICGQSYQCSTSADCPCSRQCNAGMCGVAPDLASADLSGAGTDLSMAPDLGDKQGCAAANGRRFGAVWGCPGTFAMGAARSLCAPGFHVAQDMNGVDLSACNADQAFFVADIVSYSDLDQCNQPAGSFSCTATTQMQRHRYGCGKVLAADILAGCTNKCGGFDRAFDCNANPPTVKYRCYLTTGLDSESNQETTIGVLCAPG